MGISRRSFLKRSIAAGVALEAALTPGVPVLAKSSIPKSIKAKRVLIITFDGIRVDALQQAHTSESLPLPPSPCVPLKP